MNRLIYKDCDLKFSLRESTELIICPRCKGENTEKILPLSLSVIASRIDNLRSSLLFDDSLDEYVSGELGSLYILKAISLLEQAKLEIQIGINLSKNGTI